MKSKITLLLIAFLSTLSIAQTKVGTINSDYIINLMPETKTVLKLAKAYSAKLDSTFTIKIQDFKNRYDDYKAKENELLELEKKVIQKELANLDKEIQQYQKNSNTLIGLKRDELMRPLYRKLNSVITEIAKANGYSQILTVNGNQFAYIDKAFDITDLVIKKLGITIPKEPKE